MRKTSENMDDYVQPLELWYRQNKRDLPWRHSPDPYRVLVSETMLQQTRVETVIPYFHRFLQHFPDIQTLANAPEDDVLKLWEGLGYYSRARNLQRAAKAVVESHNGCIPPDTESVRALPGVGPYTAGAVMSIAFNQPVAAVDGNVLRVMARYRGIVDPIDETSVKRQITAEVQRGIERAQPRDFTQALMELGATVCTPRNPTCLICPIRTNCVAFETGQVADLPKKKPKKKRKPVTVVALWIEQDGELLVEQRDNNGLLAGMWQLPCIEIAKEQIMEEELQKSAELCLSNLVEGNTYHEAVQSQVAESAASVHSFAEIASAHHIFTHLDWYVRVCRPIGYHRVDFHRHLRENQQFVKPNDLSKLVWPKVYHTIFDSVLQAVHTT